MIRAIIIAALVAAPVTLINETAGLVAFFAILFGLLAAPSFITRCPHCRRRVPLGADVCHRCSQPIR